MNLAIAFVLLFALNAGFGTASPNKWTVHETVEGTAASAAGVQPGDRVLSLAGVDDHQLQAVRHRGAGERRQAGRDGRRP